MQDEREKSNTETLMRFKSKNSTTHAPGQFNSSRLTPLFFSCDIRLVGLVI